MPILHSQYNVSPNFFRDIVTLALELSGVAMHAALGHVPPPLKFANARKFVVCSVERVTVQQIDIERVVDRFDALAQNRRLALK